MSNSNNNQRKPGDYRRPKKTAADSSSRSRSMSAKEEELQRLRAERAYQAALARQAERQKRRAAEAQKPTRTSEKTARRKPAQGSQKRKMTEEERQRIIRQQQKRRRQQTGKPARSAEPVMTPPKKKRKKMSSGKKKLIAAIVLIAAILLIIGFSLIYFNLNSDLRSYSILDEYGISPEAAEFALDHRIVNLAVFGEDARADVDGSRSDAILIATADYEHDKLKITSLMRDTLVYCDPEEDYDKLNTAFSLNREEGALRTINENFDTAITDYVTIDFASMVDMVNAVGGVTVNIQDPEELDWINLYLRDVNSKVGTESVPVPDIGEQQLDGSQALAYCRIRFVGNGDFDRTKRQREVFEQVIHKAMDLSIFGKIHLLNKVMPYINTSLTNKEIFKYGMNLLMMSDHSIQQNSLPDPAYLYEGFYGDASVLYPNTLTDNIRALYRIIYEADYTPSDRAQTISDEIQYLMW